MKKFVKVLVAILVVAVMGISVLSLVACDDGKTLYVYTNAAFPPFEDNKDGQIVGFDIDFIKAIAKTIGMEVKITHTEFDSVIGEVQNRKNAVAVAGLSITDERKKQINFSESYYDSYQVYIVTEDDTTYDACTTKEQANLITEGKQARYAAAGQVGYYFLSGQQDYEGHGGATALPTINECVEKLQTGKSVAIGDVATAKTLVAAKKGFKIIDIPLTTENYAVGVNKKNKDLLEKINAAIKTLEEDGTMATLRAQWLQ